MVCLCNFVKCLCIFYTLWDCRGKIWQPGSVSNIGDAIAFFLQDRKIRHLSEDSASYRKDLLKRLPIEAPWIRVPTKDLPQRWYQGVSRKRLFFTFGL